MGKKVAKIWGNLPITVKITLWYTTFVIILMSAMLIISFTVTDKISKDKNQRELTEAVNELISDNDFDDFDDGIYFVRYNNEGIESGGMSPRGFDLTLKLEEDTIGAYGKNGEKFSELDKEKILNREKQRAYRELEWANEWILEIFSQENVKLDKVQENKIWAALELLASSEEKFRTISNLRTSLNDRELKDTLEKYTIKGALGRYFDSDEENFSFSDWQVFEMEKIMNVKSAVTPLLSYLFHKVEEKLTGPPSVIVLDECWLFIDNEQFAGKIREWLKVLRKKKAGVIFATQELGDIDKSKLFTTILDSCLTKIFLPNANALSDNYFKTYKKFGLNSKEIQIIAEATPKKEYYYKSPKGSRLFELVLGENTLKLVGANDPEIQKEAKELYELVGNGENFTRKYLDLK